MNMNEWINEDATQYDKMMEERDTLIDDIDWQQKKIERLERENEKLKRENRRKHYSANENNKYYKELWNRTEEYRKENNALRLQADTYFDEWQSVKKQYTTLTDHIRLKLEMNPSVDRYIELNKFVDRLEQK